jgi:hypothetical protein
VLGGAAVAGKVALKVGILAKFGKVFLAILLAMKKFIILLLAGIGAFLRRVFGKGGKAGGKATAQATAQATDGPPVQATAQATDGPPVQATAQATDGPAQASAPGPAGAPPAVDDPGAKSQS